MGITDITTYLAGVVVIVLLRGLNSMFVAVAGVRRGCRAAPGILVGVLFPSFNARLATAAIH